MSRSVLFISKAILNVYPSVVMTGNKVELKKKKQNSTPAKLIQGHCH